MLNANLCGKSFRDDAMQTLTNEANVNDLHVAQIRLGGDVFLQPGTQRPADEISKSGKDHRQRNQPDAPKGGAGPSQRSPGKGRRKKRRGRHIGATAFMDSQFAFTGAEAGQRFIRGCRDLFQWKIAEQEKSGRVGMSSHGDFVRARQDMQRGMFKRVITPCFKDKWEIE